MKCPICESRNIRVLDVRAFYRNTNRRKRECKDCEYMFFTFEIEAGGLSEVFEDYLTDQEMSKVSNVIEATFPTPIPRKYKTEKV
ncbi:hypothetical protein [Gracilibacillus dipsosauri]|uniref:NrdR family transcriptional regulator n=1 Tax=Gracilibacillus dipsosauri TaxID=178340 RepID=UPI00240986B4